MRLQASQVERGDSKKPAIVVAVERTPTSTPTVKRVMQAALQAVGRRSGGGQAAARWRSSGAGGGKAAARQWSCCGYTRLPHVVAMSGILSRSFQAKAAGMTKQT